MLTRYEREVERQVVQRQDRFLAGVRAQLEEMLTQLRTEEQELLTGIAAASSSASAAGSTFAAAGGPAATSLAAVSLPEAKVLGAKSKLSPSIEAAAAAASQSLLPLQSQSQSQPPSAGAAVAPWSPQSWASSASSSVSVGSPAPAEEANSDGRFLACFRRDPKLATSSRRLSDFEKEKSRTERSRSREKVRATKGSSFSDFDTHTKENLRLGLLAAKKSLAEKKLQLQQQQGRQREELPQQPHQENGQEGVENEEEEEEEEEEEPRLRLPRAGSLSSLEEDGTLSTASSSTLDRLPVKFRRQARSPPPLFRTSTPRTPPLRPFVALGRPLGSLTKPKVAKSSTSVGAATVATSTATTPTLTRAVAAGEE